MTRKKRQETLVQSLQRRFDGVEDNSNASLSICSELYRGYHESCMKSKKTFLGFQKGEKENSTVAEFLRNVDAFVDGVKQGEIEFSLESGEKVLDTIRFLEWCVAGRHVFTAKCVQGMGDEAHKHTLANFTSSLLALISIQDEARVAVQTFRRARKRKEKERKQKQKKNVANIYSHLGADDDGIDDEEEKETEPVSAKPSVPTITAPTAPVAKATSGSITKKIGKTLNSNQWNLLWSLRRKILARVTTLVQSAPTWYHYHLSYIFLTLTNSQYHFLSSLCWTS